MLVRPFTPDFSFTVTVTTVNAATAFGAGAGETVEVYNAGTVPVFFTFGTSAATAAVPTGTAAKHSSCIAPGVTKAYTREPTTQTHFAAITASTTAVIYVSTGEGQ